MSDKGYKAGIHVEGSEKVEGVGEVRDFIFFADYTDLKAAEAVFARKAEYCRESTGFIIPGHERIFELKIAGMNEEGIKLMKHFKQSRAQLTQLDTIAKEAERVIKGKTK